MSQNELPAPDSAVKVASAPWKRLTLRTDGAKSGAQVVARIGLSLYSTTLVTAVLGFLFWALAARLTTAEVVGRSAAVISAMQFIAAFATLGLHTLLLAELANRDGRTVKRLVVTSLGIAGTVAFIVSVCYAVIQRLFSDREWLYATPSGIVLFALGTAVTTVTIVIDGAAIGVQQSGLQVIRNFVFALAKLIALPLAALAVGMSPGSVYAVWLLGNVVSLVVLFLRTKTPLEWLGTTPSIGGFLPLWRTAAGHHWVNVATQAPRLALPVLVAVQVSNEANAGFYAALLLVTFVWIIPSHLGVAMFALGNDDPEHFGRGLSTTLRLSALVSILAAVGTPILARPLLSIFGPEYVDASTCLIAFAMVTFAVAIKSIYIAVRRSQGALGRAAWASALGAVLELGAAEVGLKLGAVTGVGIALSIAMVVEAAFYWPAIRKAQRECAKQVQERKQSETR